MRSTASTTVMRSKRLNAPRKPMARHTHAAAGSMSVPKGIGVPASMARAVGMDTARAWPRERRRAAKAIGSPPTKR
ncbi:MAG: hypothetical protein D6781_13665 [Verrucomicrobia bacterium]|nr:MAG: hypothetical protein D6781_13665 [Verrucomicrobiota bacterium]